MKKFEIKLRRAIGFLTIGSALVVLAVSWWQVSGDFFVSKTAISQQPAYLVALDSQAIADNPLNSGIGDRVKGKANQAAGTIERNLGDATDDYSAEAKGALKELKGNAQEGIGEAKGKADSLGSKIEKAADNFTDAVEDLFD